MKDKRLGCLAAVCIVLLIMFYWAQSDPIRIRNISWKRGSSSVLEVTFTVTNNASVGKPVTLRVQAWRERWSDDVYRTDLAWQEIFELVLEPGEQRDITREFNLLPFEWAGVSRVTVNANEPHDET